MSPHEYDTIYVNKGESIVDESLIELGVAVGTLVVLAIASMRFGVDSRGHQVWSILS